MLLKETHDLQPGDTVKCTRGFTWVCVGWTTIPDGSAAIFVRDMTGLHGTSDLQSRMWLYHVTMSEAFERKFTNANQYQR